MCLFRARPKPQPFIFPRDPAPIPEYWSNLKSTPPSSHPTNSRETIQAKTHRRWEPTSSTSNQSLSHRALASGQLYNPYSFPNPRSPASPFGVPVTPPFFQKPKTSRTEALMLPLNGGNTLRKRSRIPQGPVRGILKKHLPWSYDTTCAVQGGRIGGCSH